MPKSFRFQYWFLSVIVIAAFAPAFASGGEPVELAHGASGHEPKQPQVAVGADGAIHVIYGVGNVIRYQRSDQGGTTFTEPVSLPTINAMSLGMRRGPRIAVTDKAICVTAIGGKQGKGRDGDLLATRSTDGGKTWTRPTPVNDVEAAAREGLHGMAAGPRGDLCCVWLDLRNGETEVMASTSADGGATWTKNVLVYASPYGSVCECCHPSVAYDGQGRIHVLWRNSLGGARDMYVASSANGGTTFGAAMKLGSGTWPLDACPMDGGAIAAANAGKLAAVWRRENDIYLTLGGQHREQRLGVGEQPWIAMTDEGPFATWLKKRGGTLFLQSPGNGSPSELAAHAADPTIAAGPKGMGPVVAVWEARHGQHSAIACQVIRER